METHFFNFHFFLREMGEKKKCPKEKCVFYQDSLLVTDEKFFDFWYQCFRPKWFFNFQKTQKKNFFLPLKVHFFFSIVLLIYAKFFGRVFWNRKSEKKKFLKSIFFGFFLIREFKSGIHIVDSIFWVVVSGGFSDIHLRFSEIKG